MAHGQGQTSNRTGGYGALSRGTRGHGKDKAVKKAEQRERDDRWQRAKEETDRARLELEELMEKQRKEPAMGEVAGALYAAQEREAKEKLDAAQAEQRAAKDEVEKELAALEKIAAKPVKKKFLDPEPTESESGLPMRQPLWKFEKDFDPDKLPQEGEGTHRFAVTMAIGKLKMGYHVTAVLDEFGIGVRDLPEGLFDELGWGIRPDANKESDEADSGSGDN